MNTLEYATNVERKNVSYYRKLAKRNRDNCLSSVFLQLANEENEHLELLKKAYKNIPYELYFNDNLDLIINMLNIENNTIISKGFIIESEFETNAFYRVINNIHMYRELLLNPEYNKCKDLFIYLLIRENKHLRVIDFVVKLANANE